MSIEPVQLVKEAQQDLFEANGLTAPLTLNVDPQDLEATLAWLELHAPAMRDFVLSQRDQENRSMSNLSIDWIDTSWTNNK